MPYSRPFPARGEAIAGLLPCTGLLPDHANLIDLYSTTRTVRDWYSWAVRRSRVGHKPNEKERSPADSPPGVWVTIRGPPSFLPRPVSLFRRHNSICSGRVTSINLLVEAHHTGITGSSHTCPTHQPIPRPLVNTLYPLRHVLFQGYGKPTAEAECRDQKDGW